MAILAITELLPTGNRILLPAGSRPGPMMRMVVCYDAYFWERSREGEPAVGFFEFLPASFTCQDTILDLRFRLYSRVGKSWRVW